MPSPLDLLSVQTVAAMLEVDPKTVRALWARGLLPDPVALPTGGKSRRQLRWRRCEIEAYLMRLQTVKPDPPGRQTEKGK